MNWLQNPNLWIFIIFMALPALQAIAQRIKKQRDIAKAKEAIRRKQEETLRTGRASAEDQAAATARAEATAREEALRREAMQRRQEQLRELRRKQMEAQAEARARARQSQSTRTRPGPMPAPSQTQTRMPTPQAPSSPQRRPTSRPVAVPGAGAPGYPESPGSPGTPGDTAAAAQRRRQQALQQAAARRAAEAQRRQEAIDQDSDEVVRPLLARFDEPADVSAVDASGATTTGADLLSNLTADDWRRGIILAEVLGRPVSERSEPRLF